MTAPGNGLLFFLLTLSVIVSSGYAIGRIHQWHRHGLERDEAYRTGYEKASQSIVGMMTGRDSFSPAPGPRAVRRDYSEMNTNGRRIINQRRLYPAHRDEADRAHI